MTLEVLKQNYVICKLDKLIDVPEDAEFFAITVTDKEISLVCEQEKAPQDCTMETGFRAMRIKGILDFSLTGIIAWVSGILAHAGISIFTVSTYDTDYVLVREVDLEQSVSVLKSKGCLFEQTS